MSKRDLGLDSKIQDVTKSLQDFADTTDLAVAIRIDLNDFQYRADINGAMIFSAASVLKLAISMAIEYQVACGLLNLRYRHSLQEMYKLSRSNSILRGLVNTSSLTSEELVRIMLISSDELATYQLLKIIDVSSINKFLHENNFVDTQIHTSTQEVSVSGQTSAHEALNLLLLSEDSNLFPVTSSALRNSIMNSRIPLGVTDRAILVSHKTGSLPGVANDVAKLDTKKGSIYVSFLSRNQEDTVITGYKMGLCTAQILRSLGLAVSRSNSIVSFNNV